MVIKGFQRNLSLGIALHARPDTFLHNKPKINNSTVDDRNDSQIDINKILNWPTENAERYSNFELVIRYDLNLEPCRGVYSH